jgi:hypothetical protein
MHRYIAGLLLGALLATATVNLYRDMREPKATINAPICYALTEDSAPVNCHVSNGALWVNSNPPVKVFDVTEHNTGTDAYYWDTHQGCYSHKFWRRCR